jgi:AcrR family transcriptional regulator
VSTGDVVSGVGSVVGEAACAVVSDDWFVVSEASSEFPQARSSMFAGVRPAMNRTERRRNWWGESIANAYLSGVRQVNGYDPTMPATVRRTQAERSAASQAALLRAAAELIAERGPDGASLRSIGTRAGMSRAMPSYHFGSSDELIARIVRQGNEETIAATGAAIERARGDVASLSALDFLRMTIETYLEVIADPDAPEERAVVVLWGASFPSESPLSAVRESDDETHELLAGLIREGQTDGSIRSDVDAGHAAALVMGLARGVAGLSLNRPELASAEVRRLCGQAILATLTPDAR